jgi:hypothetical protein
MLPSLNSATIISGQHVLLAGSEESANVLDAEVGRLRGLWELNTRPMQAAMAPAVANAISAPCQKTDSLCGNRFQPLLSRGRVSSTVNRIRTATAPT